VQSLIEQLEQAAATTPLDKQDDSFRFVSSSPSKNGGWKGNEFMPLSVTEFMAKDPTDGIRWVLEGYLPVGGIVVLAAKPKVGKTTLAYHMAAHIVQGISFLDCTVVQTPVLILAVEEHEMLVRDRLRNVIGESHADLYVHCGRFRPTELEALRDFIARKRIGLVILDTLAAYWTVKDENDAVQVQRAIQELRDVARDTEACVLVIHHCRKSEGSGGDEIRGSSALLGEVDIALMYSSGGHDTQRRIKTEGRVPGTIKQLIIDLENGEYQVAGRSSSEVDAHVMQRVEDALREAASQTVDELTRRTNLGRKKVDKYLVRLVGAGRASKTGTGHKGDPFRYTVRLQETVSTADSFLSTPNVYKEETETQWMATCDVDDCDGGGAK